MSKVIQEHPEMLLETITADMNREHNLILEMNTCGTKSPRSLLMKFERQRDMKIGRGAV